MKLFSDCRWFCTPTYQNIRKINLIRNHIVQYVDSIYLVSMVKQKHDVWHLDVSTCKEATFYTVFSLVERYLSYILELTNSNMSI